MGNIYYHIYDSNTGYEWTGGTPLEDVIEATVNHKETGEFVMNFTIPNTTENRAMADLLSNNYFTAKTRPLETDRQVFLPKTVRYRNGLLYFTCQHISSALGSLYYARHKNATPFSGPQALAADLTARVQSWVIYPAAPTDTLTQIHRFEIKTEMGGAIDFNWTEPKTIASLIWGDYSLLRNFGGVIDVNNFTIWQRPTNSVWLGEITFEYGEDLLPDYYELDITNYAELVHGVYFPSEESGILTVREGDYYFLNRDNNRTRQRTVKNAIVVDLSDWGPYLDSFPAYVQQWMDQNVANYPGLQYKAKINPVMLWQTTEPGSETPVDIRVGTRVHVIDPTCGLDILTNVISYDYDILKDQYTAIEISNAENKLPKLLSNLAKASGVQVYN